MSIKAVLWDFSGVLCIPVEGRGHAFLAQSLGLSSDILEQHFQSELNQKVNLGEISSNTFYRTLFAEQGISQDLIFQFEEIYSKAFEINAPIVDFINFLHKTKKIGLLSNYSDRLRPILENEFGIANIFDDVVISSEVKMMKPDESIYHLALARLDVKPEETIFVDDLIENVEAAANIGIHAIHFQNSAQVIAEIYQLIN